MCRTQPTILQMVRDQFSITTWLSIGAIIQATAYALLPYRNIVTILPVLLFLGYKLAFTACVLFGLVPNSRMKDVLLGHTTPVFPDEKGNQDKPADRTICAIVLGVVSNHPLGLLGPAYKEIGDQFEAMCNQMSDDATKYGYLGHSSWLNASDNTTSSEFMSIVYFENEDYLHDYAHGPMHSDTMQWWRKVAKDVPHIGIMHEVFACPKKSWEGVYINYAPTGGLILRAHRDVMSKLTMIQVSARRAGRSSVLMVRSLGSILLSRPLVSLHTVRAAWGGRTLITRRTSLSS